MRMLSAWLGLFALAASSMAQEAPPECVGLPPLVFNVGLPYTEGLRFVAAQKLLEDALGPHYRPPVPCRQRPLQVNAAVGSDYQMLDWLGSSAVDMAVVSTLTLHLLQRDGIDLVEITGLPEHPLIPTQVGTLLAREVGNGRTVRPQPERDLDDFRRALLARATAAARRGATELQPGDRLQTQLVFPSHLSTIGFLLPLAETQRWLETALAAPKPGGPDPGAVRTAFWNGFFDHACFHFGSRPKRGPTCKGLGGTIDTRYRDRGQRELPGLRPAVEIEVEANLAPAGAPLAAPTSFRIADVKRDHLVMRRDRAKDLFDLSSRALTASTTSFVAVGPVLGGDLGQLFGSSRQADELTEAAAEEALAPPFKSYLQPERFFGTRTFSFTADESLRLLAAHEAASGRPGLALVLPGGGVKAAYQSRVIDEAYRQRYLVNQRGDGPAWGGQPLAVRDVIGTSGGALLGYFVAQLGPQGPFDLSKILWFVTPARGGDDVELDSAAVFGWTDLPRYASLLTIFLVFSIGLAASSLPPRGWLAPRAADGSAPALTSMRIRLLLPITVLLVGTPLLVRRSSGDLSLEHVPEFEGLLYAVLLVAALYADQCLVERAEPLPPAAPALRAAKHALGFGLGLMTLPALVRFVPQLAEYLEAKVAASLSYLGLGAAAVVLMLHAVRRRRGRLGAADVVLWFVAFVAGTAAAYVVLRHVVPVWALAALDRAPLFFVGLGVTLVATILVRLGRGRKSAWLSRLEERGARLVNATLVQLAARVLAPFFVCLLTLDLTRPIAEEFTARTLLELLEPSVASKLDVPLGGLGVCVGALIVLYGIVATALGSGRFERAGGDEFANAVLFVLVGLSIAVYVSLLLVSWWAPDSLTLFELTPQFWLGLLAATAAGSALLLLWAYFRPGAGPGSKLLHEALQYLCSRHPNAHLVTRRFVRMLLFAAACLVWWNLLLAPGLYGNRYAGSYFKGVIRRFAQSTSQPGAEPSLAPRLTTNLIAIANELETRDTRFFLVVPDGEPCTPVRLPPGSGSTWYRYHASTSPEPHPHPEIATCRELDVSREDGQKTLGSFVFASGSPFPIFPAHRVTPVKDGKSEALVDGGYTNNTPVEAAHQVGAERVLIVNSSHPLPAAASGGKGIATLTGPLVDLGLRLPGFLLERAQQLDRRGRAELFVVSLSPLPRPDWPFLSDFRGKVVRDMLDSAWEDLGRRIGMVESWGRPRFQLSQSIGARQEPELTPKGAPSAEEGEPRARSGDLSAPPPSRSR